MKCYCKGTGKYTTEKGGDCNDSSASIKPGASEVCNNQDDNCSGEPDETFPCRTGQSQQEECTKCGTHSRSCANCNWGPWGTCLNQGACEKYSTAACTDGCGTRTCSSSCDWGSCAFTKDPYEPNDTWNTAEGLGTLKDGATTKTVSNATFHSNGDYDRFYVNVEESGSLVDWTMTLSATLSGVSGSHTMCLYYDRECDGGVDHTKCGTQSGSLTVKTDDLDPNWGENNDGCIDIELYGAWSCSKYTLQLTLDP
ncbi:MAG: putative metal-binding motif-containing protein [Deltaproteobacteria bacterium]|nr:putative metal-binding motif-containing protein [Deltaproteobacteria bacterium]